MPSIIHAHSVRGASHVRKNTCNQDSVGGAILPNGISFVAVADGHGGTAYTRSERGSALAVKTVEQILLNLPSAATEAEVLSALDGIQPAWKQAVLADIASVWGGVGNGRMYGTTLSVAVRTAAGGVVTWACGDGDVFVVLSTGARALPGDGMVGVETHSLGTVPMSAVRRTTRTREQLEARGVTGVILTTDGVVNSFTATADAEAVITQIAGGQVHDVPALLQAITEGGSGDDVSIIMLQL